MADDWTVVSEAPISGGQGDWSVVSEAPIASRTAGERFRQNTRDAFSQSGLVAPLRNAFTNPTAGIIGVPRVPDIFDALGPVGGAIRSGAAAGGLVARGTRPGLVEGIVRDERQARADYAKQSAQAPFYTAPGGLPGKALAGGATLAGQFVGAAPDPMNFAPMGATLLRRAGLAAATGAASDVTTQGADIGAGIRDKYEPTQTLAAAALSPALQVGSEGLAKAAAPAGRALADVAGKAAKGWKVVSEAPANFSRSMDILATGHDPSAPTRRAAVSHSDVWKRLIKQESGGNQAAVSPKGAFGRAQLMPGTALQVATDLGDPGLAKLARTDGDVNEYLGQIYYGQMLEKFDGDHLMAAAAYNAGPGRVERWVKRFGTPDEIGRQAWIDKIPIAETKGYVQNVAKDFIEDGMPPGQRAMPELAGGPSPLTTPESQGLIVPDQAKLTADLEAARSTMQTEPVEGWQPVAEAPLDAANPIPMTVSPVVPQEKPVLIDLTDQALDVLRGGDKVRLDQGQSLMEWIARNGGIADTGGEMKGIGADAWHRARPFMPKLVREGGRSLDDLAVAVQERGFLPTRQGEGDLRAQPADLIAAIREEVSGRPRFAREDPEGAELKARVQDMDEILNTMGLDPQTMSNAEIKAAINDMWGEPDSKVDASEDIQDLVFGLRNTMGSTKGDVRFGRKPGAVAAADPKNIERVEASVAEMAQRLKDVLDITHRQGRMAMRGALGTYNRQTGVIRTRGMQELDVLAHESGHAMEFTKAYPGLLKAMKAHSGELKPLDYDADRGSRQEGFAEFLRWYITNPTHAKQAAPGFYDAFEAEMGKDAPDVLDAMKDIQRTYEDWLHAPSAAVVSSMVVSPPKRSYGAQLRRLAERRGPMAAVSEFFAEGYRGIFDKLNPMHRAVQRLIEIGETNGQGKRTLKVAEDPYKQMRMVPGASQAGHMDLMHGVHPYQELEPEGPSLADALTTALGAKFFRWDEKALNDFGAYLAARRMLQEWARYGRGELDQPPDQLSAEVHQQAIADFERGTNHDWPKAAAMVYEWTNNLWKKELDAGFITPEQYLLGLEKVDYVPVMRDMSEKEGGGSGKGSSTKRFGGVSRFKGSTRQIINPINSLMQKAYDLNYRIAVNDAITSLDKLALDAGPEGGSIAERIPNKDLKAVNVDAVEVMKKAMDEMVLDERDLIDLEGAIEAAFPDGTAPTKIFRATDTNEKGEPIVYGWKDGERFALRLADGDWGKNMVEAISNMNKPVSNAFIEIAAAPARALRFGVTAHPSFFFANTLRDQLTAFVLTDVGYKPFASQARGLASELAQDGLTREYNRMGGIIGGGQSAAERLAKGEKDIQALRKRGYPIRRFGSITGIAQATELAETGTRLGIYRNAKKQAMKSGMSEWEAAQEASFAARDYMDFDRRGGWGTTELAARLVPFFGASLQALDKSRRVAGGVMKAPEVAKALLGGPGASAADQRAFNHVMKFWASAAALGAMGLGIRAAYSDDPEYQELADYLRNTHWLLKLPTGDYAAWPKPFDIAALSNIAERVYEATYLKDPTAWERMREGLIGENGIMIPAHDAPIIGLPFQLASNRDSFGSPIVPEHLRNVEPQDQYGSQTSEVSKGLGDMLNMSPAQIDHLLKGFGGSWARDLLKGSDAVMRPDAPKEGRLVDTFLAGRFIKDWTRGSASSKEFWELASDAGKWAAGEGSVRKLMTSNKIPQAVEKLKEMEPQQRAWVLNNMFSEGDWKLAHPMVRAARSSGVISDLMSDLQEGNIRGADLQPLDITPAERKDALIQLSRLGVAEKRNAMIDAGVEGWEQKERLPREEYLAKIPKDIRDALTVRWAVEFKDPRLADPQTMAGTWQQLRPMLEAEPNAAAISAAMEAKRTAGRTGAERGLREVAPAR